VVARFHTPQEILACRGITLFGCLLRSLQGRSSSNHVVCLDERLESWGGGALESCMKDLKDVSMVRMCVDCCCIEQGRVEDYISSLGARGKRITIGVC